MSTKSVRAGFVGMFVVAEWLVLVSIGYITVIVFRIPQVAGFSVYVRSIGVLASVSSLLVFGWLTKYRKPADILNSTYVTFLKLLKRTPLQERAGRSEPLVVKGPYRYVRHPLYLGVILLVLGLWLLVDWTPFLITTILFLVWFNFVLAPFEERELVAIFGDAYEEYARHVPKIIPIPLLRSRQV